MSIRDWLRHRAARRDDNVSDPTCILEALEQRLMLSFTTGSPFDVFPIDLGSSWQYSGVLNGAAGTSTWQIDHGRQYHGRFASGMEATVDGLVDSTTDYYSNINGDLMIHGCYKEELRPDPYSSTGFFLYMESETYTSPKKLLPAEVTVGQTYHSTGAYTGWQGSTWGELLDEWTGTDQTWITPRQWEVVTVPAGTFEALKVEITTTWQDDGGDSGREDDVWWLVEGLGIVKATRSAWAWDWGEYQSYGYSMELTSSSWPLPEADLVISEVSPTTLAALPGAQLSLTVTAANIGRAAADSGGWPFDTTLFLSSDDVLDYNDPIVHGLGLTWLDPGADADHVFHFTAPSEPGAYWLLAVVDTYDGVREDDEWNNLGPAVRLVVDDPFVDLAVSVGPEAQMPVSVVSGDGTPIRVPVTVTNNGNVATAPGQLGGVDFWASGQQAYCSLGTWTDVWLGSLAPGETRTFSRTVYLPPGLATGRYRIDVLAGLFPPITEPNPNDNWGRSDWFDVIHGFVDLAGRFGQITLPTQVVSGQPVTGQIPVTVTNLGNVPLPATQQVDLTAWAHSFQGRPDQLLVSAPGQWVGGLGAGQSQTFWLFVHLPDGLPEDMYYLAVDIAPAPPLNEEDSQPGNNTVHSDGEGEPWFFDAVAATVDLAALIDPSVRLPLRATSGDGTPIWFPVAVINYGTVASEPGQTIDIDIYARNVTHNHDVYLTTWADQWIGSLAPWTWRTFYRSVLLPPGLDSGEYKLVAHADAGDEVAESDEANNIAVTDQSIDVALGYVDLTGTFGSISLPQSVVGGEAIGGSVTVTVTNGGNVALPAGQRVDAIVQARPTGPPGAPVVIHEARGQWIGGLGANQSQTLWLWVDLPVGLPANTYELEAQITPSPALNEQVVGNNLVTSDADGRVPTIVSADPFVDLAGWFGSVTVPDVALADRRLSGSVPVVVTNLGNVPLPAGQHVSIRVTAERLDAGGAGHLLVEKPDHSVGYLAAGGTSEAWLYADLPQGLPAGEYFLLATIEPVEPLTETHQHPNNNVVTEDTDGAVLTIDVDVALVDLEPSIAAYADLPDQCVSGDGTAIQLPVVIANHGNVAFSWDRQMDVAITARPAGGPPDGSQDVYVTTWQDVALGGLAAGGTMTVSKAVHLPPGMATGDYFLAARADSADEIDERDEANNQAVCDEAIGVTHGFVDLAGWFGNITVPSSVIAGRRFSGYVPVTVTNLGNVPLPSGQRVDIQVSAQLIGGGPARPLEEMSNRSVSRLAGNGGTRTFWVYVSQEEGLPAGTYDIVAEIVPVEPLSEEDTQPGNNTVTKDADGRVPTIVSDEAFLDLVPSIADWAAPLPDSCIAGDGTAIYWPVVVTNEGNVSVPRGTEIDIAIMAHPAFSPEDGSQDVSVATWEGCSIGGTSAGGSRTFNRAIHLPRDMATDDYFLIARVDASDVVAEKDESNNRVAADDSIDVTHGFVDLAGSFGTVTVPESVVAGVPVTGHVPVIVTNLGNVAVPAGQHVDIHVTAEPTDGGGAHRLAERLNYSVGNLGPDGATRKRLVWVNLQEGLPAGTYEIVAEILPVEPLDEEDSQPGNNTVTEDADGERPTISSDVAHVDLVPTFGQRTDIPEECVSGDGTPFYLSVVVTNEGNVALPYGQTVNIDIAARRLWGPDDGSEDIHVTTWEDRSVSELGPDGYRTIGRSVYLPPGMAEDWYEFVVHVDADERIEERDEENNVLVSDDWVDVEWGFVDLTGHFIDVGLPTAVIPGDPIREYVQVAVENQGSVPLPRGQRVDVVMEAVPTDPVGSPIRLGEKTGVWVGQLAAEGGATSAWITVDLPGGLPANTYDLRAVITPVPPVNEHDQPSGNNTVTRDAHGNECTLVSRVPFVDLAIEIEKSGLTGSPIGGDSRTAKVHVRNIGNVNASGRIDVQIQAVPAAGGEVIDLGEPSDQQLFLGPGGAQTTRYVRYTLPLDIPTDDYRVTAAITAFDGIADVSRANDTAPYLPGTFHIRQAELDLTPDFSRIYLPDLTIAGTKKTLYVDVSNVGNRAFTATVDVEVFASADGELAGAQLIGVVEDKTKYFSMSYPSSFPVKVRFDPDTPTGDYYLIARVVQQDATYRGLDDPANDSDVSDAAYAVEEAFVDLEARISDSHLNQRDSDGLVQPGKTTGWTVVQVVNVGNTAEAGDVRVDLVARRKGTGKEQVLATDTVEGRKFWVGCASWVPTLHFDVPDGMPEGGYDVRVVATPLTQFLGKDEPDTANNTVHDVDWYARRPMELYHRASWLHYAGHVESWIGTYSKWTPNTVTVGDPALSGRFRAWMQFLPDGGRRLDGDWIIDLAFISFTVSKATSSDEARLQITDLGEALFPGSRMVSGDRYTGRYIWKSIGSGDVLAEDRAPRRTDDRYVVTFTDTSIFQASTGGVTIGLMEEGDDDDEFEFVAYHSTNSKLLPYIEVYYHDPAWD